jgi:hypothetical protein
MSRTYRQGSPHSYASRTLNSPEKNYPAVEKELLAIVWRCKHFRQYLYGRKFTIGTDHRPLSWIFGLKDPSSRLLKWRLKLEEYDYEVIYKKGPENKNADALRIHVTTTVSENGGNKPRVSQEDKARILKEKHENQTGGDLGVNRTYESFLCHCQVSNKKLKVTLNVVKFFRKTKLRHTKPKCPCRLRLRRM